MILNLLFTEPAFFLAWIVAIIFGITIHEFSHALGATLLGDRTPKYEGRLTLNPLSHIDFMGFIVLLFAGFGWGKPVGYNPFNIKYRRWGPVVISLLGPLSNFIAMFFFGFTLKILLNFTTLDESNMLLVLLAALVHINLILGVFNLFPIPPLDGHHILYAFLPPSMENFKRSFSRSGPIILLTLILIDNFARIGIIASIFRISSNFIFKIFG